MSEHRDITSRQRQTLAGRQKFAERFATPEEKSEHFRQLAERSASSRVVLSGEEAAALNQAYALLSRIAARTQREPAPTDQAA